MIFLNVVYNCLVKNKIHVENFTLCVCLLVQALVVQWRVSASIMQTIQDRLYRQILMLLVEPANQEQRFKTFSVMAHAHLQGHFICPTTFHFQTQPQI